MVSSVPVNFYTKQGVANFLSMGRPVARHGDEGAGRGKYIIGGELY